MRWVKIAFIIILALSICTVASIAAEYSNAINSIKVNFAETPLIQFFIDRDHPEAGINGIIKETKPALITSQIEEMARAQQKVGNCI
jgi:hypothetical protein